MSAADEIISTPLEHGGEPCPSCGALLEVISGNGTPEPGTITLCAYCFVFLVLTAEGRQRMLSDADWLEMPADERAHLTGVRDWFVDHRRP